MDGLVRNGPDWLYAAGRIPGPALGGAQHRSSRFGVLLLSVAETAAARDRDVAGYVRRQAAPQLAPGTRDRVLALLDAGAVAGAVSLYFDTVGDEWDREWLYLAVVAQPAAAVRRPSRRREVR